MEKIPKEKKETRVLTPVETLCALSAGRKIRFREWPLDAYIHLVGDNLRTETGTEYYCGAFNGFLLYEEPKPKRKVAPYIVTTYGVPGITNKFYETDSELIGSHPDYCKIVRRVTELEVEV